MFKNNSNKLTIVIFSYNRPNCLLRAIKYWSKFDFKILILDGSDKALKISRKLDKKIMYIHNSKSLHDRLLNSINFIETEFVMLATDDEFYLPSAILSCVNFLLKNNEYVSCGGRAVKFYTKKNNVFGKKCYPKLENLSLNDSKGIDRVKKHFSNYVPAHFYSIIRSNIYKIICKYIFEKNYKVFALHELQFEFLVMISGKSKIIPELIWIRNDDELKVSVKYPKLAFPISIDEWWYDEDKREDKKNFLKRTEIICNVLNPDKKFKFNKKIISNLFEIYINKKKNRKAKNRSYLKRLVKLFPNQIIKFIKILIFWEKIKLLKAKSLLDEANFLEKQNVLINYKELKNVILTITASNG